jgi:hypothetical protein
MNINEIKAELRDELKGAMGHLFQAQQSGQIGVADFLKAQGNIFDHYKAMSSKPVRKAAPKASKTTKAPKVTYRVRDLTSGMPKYHGDLYPTREAAESARNSLPFTVQWASEVVTA